MTPADLESKPADTRVGGTSIELQFRYAVEPGAAHRNAAANPLFELLTAVLEGGSIRRAAEGLGKSYRYVWGALRKWEKTLGQPLVIWAQGQRARPTQFAERLLWAEHRARSRMQPHLDALQSDLSEILAEVPHERNQMLSLRASHDMALPVLQRHLAESAGLRLQIDFQGSADALRSLNERKCLVAGFHVPCSNLATPIFSKALKPLLNAKHHTLIGCSVRSQGLMMRRELAARVRGLADVSRLNLRFVNRQAGSGTRMLIDSLLNRDAVSPDELIGYQAHYETSHVAVALCIASGVADVGVGVKAAALEFGLHFQPLVQESYFLACLTENLSRPAVGALRSVLASVSWAAILANLPGYQASPAAGSVLALDDALPWHARRAKRSKMLVT
ncbi:MAG TPA: substrate-binding domain-containing protein [Steroidobacteraceae bacterium]